MRIGMFLAAFGTGAVIIFACSAAVPVKGAAPGPEASVSPSLSGVPHWTASIRSVSRTRFDAPDSTREKSYGSAQWTRADVPTQSRVNLTFSYGGSERVLSWAILFGNCGAGSMSLLPVSAFPELEITAGGHAQVDATLMLELATSGNYHIDIYRDRQASAESVVGCGNLRYSAG